MPVVSVKVVVAYAIPDAIATPFRNTSYVRVPLVSPQLPASFAQETSTPVSAQVLTSAAELFVRLDGAEQPPPPPQPGNLNDAILVTHGAEPVV